MSKIIDKKIRLDKKTKLRFIKSPRFSHLHINLGRYTKNKGDVRTWTLYDSITERHKPYAHIWADYQNNKLIGFEVCWEK